MKTRRSFLARLGLCLAGITIPFFPRRAKAIPVICGPVCTLAIVLAILGIALFMVAHLLKWCKKLHKRNDAQDPNKDDPPSFVHYSQAPGVPVVTLDDRENPNTVSAWDISDSGFRDADGFLYCVLFKFNVESCNQMGQPWESVVSAVGYLSFSADNALDWTDSYGGCYMNLANGSVQPRNVKIKWYRAGVLATTTYEPAGVQHSLGLTIPPADAKDFRIEYPAN